MMTTKKEGRLQAELTLAHHDFGKGLSGHAFFKVHDHTMSEDLIQDTFMKTWKYLVKGGKVETMKAFLYHILNDLIIDEYRKRKTTSLDAMLENGYEPSVDDSERLINTMDGKKVVELIGKLPPSYQKVMRMRYVQSLSLKEMALITGQSRNTMAVQAHRGLEKLKALYNHT